MSGSAPPPEQTDAYASAGVDTTREEEGMAGLLRSVHATFAFRPGIGRPLLPIGYFANVLDLGNGQGLAISTDGVGTKLLIAELLDRYDTVGIDCVAMNVNDVLCVGAEPISLVDYLAVQVLQPSVLAEIGKGLAEGARQARCAIPGGEIAQVREMVHGARPDAGIDLVGSVVGLVPTERIVTGKDLAPGDVVVGLRSSGIHSNGFTLAREVLLKQAGLSLDQVVPPLDRPLGEVLLTPTRIYVGPVLAMLERLQVKALSHITSDGLLNLLRVDSEVGFRIEFLPEPPPIFQLIQLLGKVPLAQMYQVFNMGVGFCIVVPPHQADAALAIAHAHGFEADVLGHVVAEPKRTVQLVPVKLVGTGSSFTEM